MPSPDSEVSKGLGGAIVGIAGTAIGALIRWWPRRQKEKHDNDVGLAEIYQGGLTDIMERYRKEITELKTELLESKLEQVRLRADNEELRDALARTPLPRYDQNEHD